MLLHKGETTCCSSNLCATGKAKRMTVMVLSQTPGMPLAVACGTLTLCQSRESHQSPQAPGHIHNHVQKQSAIL